MALSKSSGERKDLNNEAEGKSMNVNFGSDKQTQKETDWHTSRLKRRIRYGIRLPRPGSWVHWQKGRYLGVRAWVGPASDRLERMERVKQPRPRRRDT
jgi:hypothetical protein